MALALRAFRPCRLPFPLPHIDTGHNFPEALEFRDRREAEIGEELLVRGQDTIDAGRARRGGRQAQAQRPPDGHPAEHCARVHGQTAVHRVDVARVFAQRKDPLLGPRLLFIAPAAPDGRIQPVTDLTVAFRAVAKARAPLSVAVGLDREVDHRFEMQTLGRKTNPPALVPNDIGRIQLQSDQPLCLDLFQDYRATGASCSSTKPATTQWRPAWSDSLDR